MITELLRIFGCYILSTVLRRSLAPCKKALIEVTNSFSSLTSLICWISLPPIFKYIILELNTPNIVYSPVKGMLLERSVAMQFPIINRLL